MQNAPGPTSAPAAAVPAERKRKNRWDQGVPKEEPPEKMSAASLAALSAASAVKMQVVEAAATSVAQNGSQYEAVLQQQPQNAWLLQPSSSEYSLYQQRLKVLRAQRQAELLSKQALPSQQAISAIAKAAAASAGLSACAAAAAAPPSRPARWELPTSALLQSTGSGGMMATNTNGVGRVFYPPPMPPPPSAPSLPPMPDTGGFAAAPGGVGRVFYPPTPEEAQAAEAQAASAAAEEAAAAPPPRRKRRGFREERPEPAATEAEPAPAASALMPPPPAVSSSSMMPPPPAVTSSMRPPPPSLPARRAPHGAGWAASSAASGGASLGGYGGGTSLGSYLPTEEAAKLAPGAAAAREAAGAPLDGGHLGHQVLASMGWQGRGPGAQGEGIGAPLSGGRPEDGKARPGLGSADPTAAAVTDDAFELYKKRMSKGYQYRSAINQAGPQNNFMPGTVPPPRSDRQ